MDADVVKLPFGKRPLAVERSWGDPRKYWSSREGRA